MQMKTSFVFFMLLPPNGIAAELPIRNVSLPVPVMTTPSPAAAANLKLHLLQIPTAGITAEQLRLSVDAAFSTNLPQLNLRMLTANARVRVRAQSPQFAEQIKAFVGTRRDYIPKKEVDEFLRKTGLTADELLIALLPLAKDASRPEVSNYPVGAVGLGLSGNIYFGGNLSFIGVPNAQTVHGEQAVVANAAAHGEVGLVALAITDPPCGSCRQFLFELRGGKDIRILIPQKAPVRLGSLLKGPYTRNTMDLLGPNANRLVLPASLPVNAPMDLATAALDEANKVNSLYTCSGVAIRTRDGRVFTGRYLDVAGGNPSLPPLQSALVSLSVAGVAYAEIAEVVLVEFAGARVVQEAATRELLQVIAPQAYFLAVKAPRP